MDNLSSTDFDASSKTPLFIGIAAVILALTGVILGWMGFSKASALEDQIALISNAADSISDMKASVDSNSETLRRAAGKITSIERGLESVSVGVRKDISDVKKSMRTLAIQAGTALKKVEALEKSGLTAAAPAPRTSPSSSSGGTKSTGAESPASLDGSRTHKIQSGDTYQKLSARYQVSVNDLIDANPGVDPRRLKIGQPIVVPGSGE